MVASAVPSTSIFTLQPGLLTAALQGSNGVEERKEEAVARPFPPGRRFEGFGGALNLGDNTEKLSVHAPKQVLWTGIMTLRGESLKFCQFPSQPCQFQEATCYFTQISA